MTSFKCAACGVEFTDAERLKANESGAMAPDSPMRHFVAAREAVDGLQDLDRWLLHRACWPTDASPDGKVKPSQTITRTLPVTAECP